MSEQVLEVKIVDGEMTAKLEQPFMSFPYDNQSSGIQQVFPTRRKDGQNLERSNLNEIWQYKFLPITDRIYWYVDCDGIKFFVNSIVPLNKVRVLYVPLVNKDMRVPSGLIDFVTTNTVGKMRSIAQGKVIKKSLDLNQNEILETEIDKAAAR